ncbi:MAG TPA: hypothetical protein VG938_14745 [Verrucomicrobiae bacterium]|jgi:hypothetical protein|nr:hypothetical protein [Verrucomicrobiae bacterium]
MSRRKHFLAALALGAFCFAGRVAASDTTAFSTEPATNRPAFGASLRGGETVGTHQVQRIFLNVGTNQFAFIVPEGFRMDASDSQKIVLYDEDDACYITVRVSYPSFSDGIPSEEYFKSAAVARFPGAKIVEQFADAAAGHTGMGFNLRWSNAAGMPQSGRTSFIPCAAGLLEFTAVAPSDHFGDAQSYMTILMTSLRSNETGKLVITPLPDFT